MTSNADVASLDLYLQKVPLRRIPAVTDSTDDYSPFSNHPILLHHMDWTPASSSTLISTDVLQTFMSTVSATPLGKKFANFFYLRSKIKLRVVVQGASFAYGQLRLVATPYVVSPYDATTTGMRTLNVPANSHLMPHVSVDPSKTQTLELTLDCPTVTGKFQLRPPAAGPRLGSYALECIVMNALRSGTATSPAVSVCVYMSLEDPVFEGVTLLASEFVEEKTSGGVLSNVFTGIATAASSLSRTFPSFRPELTLFSRASGAVGDILYYFGFAKAPENDVALFNLNRPHDNYSQFEGRSTGWVLAGTNKNSLGISPGYAGGSYDDMLISNIIAKPGLFLRDEVITQALAPEAHFQSFYVTPAIRNGYTPTPLGGVARVFRYWVGDITFDFEFMASVFHRATILIAWDPIGDINAPPTFTDAIQTLKNVTVAISGNAVTSITIPYKQLVNWQQVGTLADKAGARTRTQINGAIHMYVVNPVTANGSTDPVAYNVYLRSNNMKFAVPEPITIRDSYQTVTLLASNFVPATDVSFGSSTNLENATLTSFGEEYVSIKQLTSKATLKHNFSASFGADEIYNCAIVAPNIPVRYTGPTNSYVTFLDYFASAFVSYRGGKRYSITLDGCDAVTSRVAAIHTSEAVPRAFTQYSTFSTGGMTIYEGSYYSSAGVVLSNTGRGDFVAPSLQRTSFIPTTSFSNASTDTVQFIATFRPRSGDESVWGSLFEGSADDGAFGWFIGFPREEPPP